MGGRSFMPAGSVATMSQAVALGGVRRSKRPGSRKRKRARSRKKSAGKRRKAASTGRRKPKPGTKAWMAYIRSKRRK